MGRARTHIEPRKHSRTQLEIKKQKSFWHRSLPDNGGIWWVGPLCSASTIAALSKPEMKCSHSRTLLIAMLRICYHFYLYFWATKVRKVTLNDAENDNGIYLMELITNNGHMRCVLVSFYILAGCAVIFIAHELEMSMRSLEAEQRICTKFNKKCVTCTRVWKWRWGFWLWYKSYVVQVYFIFICFFVCCFVSLDISIF